MDSSCASAGLARTPLGPVLLVISGDRLAGLYFDGLPRTPTFAGVPRRETNVLEQVRAELDEYFAGARLRFDVPLLLEGTPFQNEVWRALMDIPAGTTATYGEVAGALGRPKAARAVGAANGMNPISIIVPCHRLVGANGALTGYGWGLDRKRRLLDHERAVASGAWASGDAEVSSGRV